MKSIMIVAVLSMMMAIAGCTREIEVTRVVEQTVIVPATVEVTREVEVTRVVEIPVEITRVVEVTREVVVTATPEPIQTVVVTEREEVPVVKVLRTVIVEREIEQISPEIIGVSVGNSDDRAIFFRAVDGATGYELCVFLSEEHQLALSCGQWESYMQTGVPGVFYVKIGGVSFLQFTLEVTKGTAVNTNPQRIDICELPVVYPAEADGSRGGFYRATEIASIEHAEDGQLVKHVTYRYGAPVDCSLAERDQ